MHFYAFFNQFYCALFSLYPSWANRSEFGFCQFARCSLLFFLLSTIAPKIKVCSSVKCDGEISKSDVPSSACLSLLSACLHFSCFHICRNVVFYVRYDLFFLFLVLHFRLFVFVLLSVFLQMMFIFAFLSSSVKSSLSTFLILAVFPSFWCTSFFVNFIFHLTAFQLHYFLLELFLLV